METSGSDATVTAKSAVVELIDVEWADSLKNPDSAYYKEIESDLVRLMEKAFTSETMGQDHPAVTYVVAAVSSFSLATGRSQTRSRRQTELSQITAGLFVYYEAEEFPGFSDTEMNKVLDEELAKDDLYDSLTVITIDNIVDTSVGTADACADGNNYCDVMASTCEPWDNQTWFTCECKEGYDDVGIGMEWGVDPGEECQLAIEATPTPSDVCPDAFCLDNGVCSADHSADGTSEQFRCQCEFWYLGDRCSYNIGIIIAVTGASLTFYIIIMTITIMVYRYHKRSRKLILPSSDGSDHGEIYSQRSVDQASVGGLRPHGRNVSDCIEGASAQPSSETVGESSMDRWLGIANILNPPSVAGTNEQLGSVSSLHSTEILLPRPHVYGRSGIASPWNVTDELVDESADSMTSRRLREVENTVYF
ncbi:PREDICTED: uncharacterized protein LOC106821652 [Priapulus caudatus]|uniref:Uncharacterized protein LOC106821652 n=1 Tax=Priapulus caudatus TaxID=37621 RepID=A0ABM1FC56_PRICU|nr:PREDICTED: uncharacterized protein LOC106821652 [Priapulus caudatus]